MKNQYKRSDVFLCSNQAHSGFAKKVSVHHVLKVKKCYPEGCVYFFWKCKKLNKGESCPRRYEHVGRKCFGCKEFYDVKISNQLKIALKPAEWERFREEFAEFEDWLREVRGKTLPIFGEIQSVKPYCTRSAFPENSKLIWKGFILTFRECYIENTFFEDLTFAVVATRLFDRFRFSPGDRLDFLAQVDENFGRILFKQIRQIEFEKHTPNPDWRLTDLPVILSLAERLSAQPEKCYRCPKGVLVDVRDNGSRTPVSRELFCLEGVRRPQDCVHDVLIREEVDVCAQDRHL